MPELARFYEMYGQVTPVEPSTGLVVRVAVEISVVAKAIYILI